MRKYRYFVPPAAVLILAIFLAIGLHLKPADIPSPFIGKPAPLFTLTQVEDTQRQFSPQDMRGKVWLLNVWASWCAPCREEVPVLMAFSQKNTAPLIGLNYSDTREDGYRWLVRFGNPYRLSVSDPHGRVGNDYGVYGVPETFLIDRQGVVRLKHVGPVTQQLVTDTLLPLIEELNRG